MSALLQSSAPGPAGHPTRTGSVPPLPPGGEATTNILQRSETGHQNTLESARREALPGPGRLVCNVFFLGEVETCRCATAGVGLRLSGLRVAALAEDPLRPRWGAIRIWLAVAPPVMGERRASAKHLSRETARPLNGDLQFDLVKHSLWYSHPAFARVRCIGHAD